MLSSRPRRVWGHIFGGLIMVKFTKAAQKVGGKLADGWGDPPPPGLEPIGDGWYRSPEVVDPRDCNNYPDSPWCGGNPLTRDPAALDIDIGFDECHVHATMSGALGFIKLPQHTISYVRSECVDEYEKRRNPPPDNPPPGTPGVYRFEYPPNLDGNAEVYAFLSRSDTSAGQTFNSQICIQMGYPASFSYTSFEETSWARYDCPGLPIPTGTNSEVYYYPPVSGIANGSRGGSGPMLTRPSGEQCYTRMVGNSDVSLDHKLLGYEVNGTTRTMGINAESGAVGWFYIQGRTWDKAIVDQGITVNAQFDIWNIYNGTPIYIAKGKWKHLKTYFQNGGAAANTSITMRADFVVGIGCSNPIDKNLPDNPPPPPPKKDCCKEMACCPQPKSQPIDNSLLLQILDKLGKLEKAIGVFPANATVFDINESAQGAQTQTITVGSLSQAFQRTIERIEKISKIIGIDDFPIEVPDTLVEPANKGILGSIFTFLFGTKTRKINNLTGFLAWQLEQDSAILGKWHQEIFVQDTDATKKGNQSKTMVVPDISSALKEILLLQISAIKILGLINDVSIKNIVETSGTKLLAAEIASRTIDIQQFLDYPTNEKIEEVAIQITPPPANGSKLEQNDLYKILQSSKAKYKFDDWTGEHSFHDMMIDLLQAAKAIMVNYSQKR